MKIKIYLNKKKKRKNCARHRNSIEKSREQSKRRKRGSQGRPFDFKKRLSFFTERGRRRGLKIRRDVSSSASSRNVEPPSQYIIKRSPPSFLCHPAQERNVTRKSTVAAICPAIKIKRLRVNFFYVDGIILDDRMNKRNDGEGKRLLTKLCHRRIRSRKRTCFISNPEIF